MNNSVYHQDARLVRRMAEYNMEILLQGREFDLVVKKLSGGGGGGV